MPENPNQSKKIIAALIVVLALALAAWWFWSKKAVQPTAGGGLNPAPTLSSTPAPSKIIGGEVLSVTLSDQKIVIGAYRVENNKAVLASQSTVYYTDATVFSREAESKDGSSAENKISPQEIKIGEVAMIVVSGASPADRLVAEKVTFILPPLPPRK